MKMLVHLLASGLAVFISSYIVEGIHVPSYLVAVIVAVVLGVLNIFLRPIIIILTLPLNILTLGLFTLVINTFMVLLADKVVPDFGVSSYWSAFLFSIALWLVNGVFHWIEKKEDI